MSTMKDFNFIRTNIRNGVYSAPKMPKNRYKKPEGFIFDEDKTVKENKQLVKEWNEKITAAMYNYYTECSQATIRFREDLKETIMSEYDFNGFQAERIIDKAYEHYDTYNDLIDKIEEIADFVAELIEARG